MVYVNWVGGKGRVVEKAEWRKRQSGGKGRVAGRQRRRKESLSESGKNFSTFWCVQQIFIFCPKELDYLYAFNVLNKFGISPKDLMCPTDFLIYCLAELECFIVINIFLHESKRLDVSNRFLILVSKNWSIWILVMSLLFFIRVQKISLAAIKNCSPKDFLLYVHK